MTIKVKLNLPTEENMEAFQDRMCFAVAKVILETKSPDYVEIEEQVDVQKRTRTYTQVNHALKKE